MLNYSVILKKSKVKQNDVTLYLTVLVRVHDNNKTEVSPSNWLNEQQVAAIKGYTPLNYSVNKRKIEENKGYFSRFNKGANLIVLRKIEYPTYNSFVVLVLNNTGISSKEVKEAELVKVAMTRKPNPLIQNAIIRGTAVYCYEDAPFDTVKGKVAPKPTKATELKDKNVSVKTPLTKTELKSMKAVDNVVVAIPNTITKSVFDSLPEANAALLESLLEYELKNKYSAGKIVRGKEKPFDCSDPNIDFVFEYTLKQTTEYINRVGNETTQKKYLNMARKYFGNMSDTERKEKALRILQLKEITLK